MVDEENINLMLERADRPHWHDVVVMAGAHARPKERAAMLRELVQRSSSEQANRETFVLLATAILEQAPVLPSDQPEVRALVNGAVQGLIPPKSTTAAERLADVGALVLDLLPELESLSDDQQVLLVHTLAGIAASPNPSNAVEWILRLVRRAERPLAKRVIEQLLQLWGRRGDYESYARDVLGDIPFGGYEVSLQNPRRIEHVGYLRTITNLVLREDSGSLKQVATLPDLRWLRLVRNIRVSLTQLEGAPSLRMLHLQACSAVSDSRPVDLTPVGRMSLHRLEISGFPTKVDLQSERSDPHSESVSVGNSHAADSAFTQCAHMPTGGHPIRLIARDVA